MTTNTPKQERVGDYVTPVAIYGVTENGELVKAGLDQRSN